MALYEAERLTADELTARVGFCARTIGRDIDKMGRLGLTVIRHRGNRGGYSLPDATRRRLAGIPLEELRSRVRAAFERGGDADAFGDLLWSGAGADGAGPRRFVVIDGADWDGHPTASALCAIDEALRRRRWLNLVMGSQRVRAGPLGLIYKDDTFFLLAQVHGGVRAFNSWALDAGSVDPETFDPPELDLEAEWRRELAKRGPALQRLELKIRLEGDADLELRRRLGTPIPGEVGRSRDGTSILLTVETREWRRWVFELGLCRNPVELLNPMSLKDAVRRAKREATAASA